MNGPYRITKDMIGYDYQMKLPFIYDVYTKNLSFIQTSKDLANLGVKNNKFFLKLYDKELLGVDPYSDALTQEQIKRIILECVRNPWYYLRELARIPSSGGTLGPGGGDPYILHRANLAATYCFLHNINHYLVIPRQCGKTQSEVATLNWAYLFGTTNSEIAFINKTQKDANDNLTRLKQQKDLLPLYLQQRYKLVNGELKANQGKDNVQTIENALNMNRIVTKPSAKTIESAENIGRGNTSPIQFYDEVEFTTHIGYKLKAAGPAFVQASKNAAKNHAPYCRILITTPGNVDSGPVEETKSTRALATRWTDSLLDFSEIQLFEYLKKNSQTYMFYIEYYYYQLGKDEDWYQSQCRELEFDKIRIKREIHLQRIRGTNDSPFDPEDLDTINNLQKPCLEEIMLHRIFNVRLYARINKNKPYIIGVDVATGTNNDNTAITIVDPYTEQAVGEFKSPLINVPDICTFLRLLIRDIVPKGILCIERNSLGDAVLELLKGTEISYNLYYDSDAFLIGSPDEKLDEKGFIKREAENRKSFGVFTNAKSREVMMAILMRLVAEKKEAFAVPYVIDDMNNLIRKASGKIEARSGEHDDNIMSFLIAMYVLYHGKKLYKWGFIRGGTPMDDDLKPMKYEDVYNEMPDDMRELFPTPEPEKDPYEEELRRAIYESQQQRQNFSEDDSAVVRMEKELDTNYNKMLEEDDYTADVDDFFRDLNS